MRIITDWIFIFIGIYCFYWAYKYAFSSKIINNRISCFIQLVLIVFNCLPIFFDYVFGCPEFKYIYWWRPMGISMSKDDVSIVYDIYMSMSILAIHCFCIKKKIKFRFQKQKTEPKNNANLYNGSKWFFDNNIILLICVFSPLISIIVKGSWTYYLVYGMTTSRGISEGFSLFSMNNLLLLSIWAFCLLYFRRENTHKWDIIILLFYSFCIAWLSGKRYIVTNMIFIYLFFFVNKNSYNEKVEKRTKRMVPIIAFVVILLSAIYLMFFKESNVLASGNIIAIYETLRTDLGRDGVTKYVIDRQLFQNSPIIDYPGASVLSALFVWMPRSIWTNKPYQHFVYLTAAIKGVSVTNPGAGITPSWYEMSVANFDFFGIILGIITIPILCLIADNIKSIEFKSIVLMLLLVLLTQSIDAYIIYLAIVMLAVTLKIFLGKKKLTLNLRK